MKFLTIYSNERIREQTELMHIECILKCHHIAYLCKVELTYNNPTLSFSVSDRKI